MAKTVPSALQTKLDSGVTTLTTIWDITRTDGVVIRLTELDADITFGGNAYESAYGYNRSALRNRAGLEFDEIDLDGILNDSFIGRNAVKAGLYDGATLLIRAIDYNAPGDGSITLTKGRLGRIGTRPDGRFTAQLSTLRTLLEQQIVEVASPTCRAQLGDTRCTVPITPALRANDTAYVLGDFIRVVTLGSGDGTEQEDFENLIYECTTAGTSASSAPTYNTTAGVTTTDGTAVFTAREAWTRHAVVNVVTDNRTFTLTLTESRAVDDWFNQGYVRFETGNNAGRVFEIKDWVQSSNTVTLFLPTAETIANGDKLAIVPGCDRLRATCRAKFAITGSANFANGNIKNFRGEPDLPGRDAVLYYPGGQ